ncbi:alpha/beta fold hydrolase [Sphingomonas canadensis]|uniref:Alpha/beta fold hydrolase n=1 Tax=Sphingomonas canadensis TaxID=1219257 RepID=A0ABW3H213_9SPHN|nr:alpha/beta hydrolase [Sphingomonas canadensis]MCW3834612.1 alpha/beta hydrolase [Sphingomonas canadensis]
MSVLLWVIGIAAAIAVALVLLSLWIVRKIDAALPATGAWIDVKGGRIHYSAMGPADAKGPPLVMIHGIMGQLRHFTYAFADRMAKDHRVILIDRPGWGHSTLHGPRAPISRQADMIAEALGKLGVEKPVLVGHSMGGAVSLAIAVRHPELPSALALIAPLTQPIEKVVDTFRGLMVPTRLAPIIAWTLSIPMGMRNGAKNAAQAFSPDPVPADFGVKGGGLLALKPASFQSGVFEIATALPEMQAQAARYAELKIPVAILYGRGDYLLDPELHGEKTAAAIPGGRLTLVEGGHMLQVCHVDATEEWLRALLAAQAPAPAPAPARKRAAKAAAAE